MRREHENNHRAAITKIGAHGIAIPGLFISLLLVAFSPLATSSASSVDAGRASAAAPGNVTARARATFSTTTTETFTLTAQVFTGSTDCTSGGGSIATINNVGQAGYTIALGPTDSVLFSAPDFSDQSNETVLGDLSGRFVDWLVPPGQVGGLTFPPGSDGSQVCVQGLDSPSTREVQANYSPVIQLRDPTCTTQLTEFHPGDTVCLRVFGGVVDAPSTMHYFGAGGTSSTSTECTFLPIPPANTPVPVTGDPSSFLFTFPSSNAAIPPACATLGNTTDIRGPWRIGVISPDGNGARAIKTFQLTDPTCTLSCPPNVSVSNDPGDCGAVVNYTTPSGAACGTVTCDHPSGSFFPVGTTQVTCTSPTGPTCSFNVTVADDENPTITAPPAVTVGTDPGTCSATGVALGTPTTDDNCTVSSASNNAPASFPLGQTTVTWTVNDNHGHSATATQLVTVVDLTPPTITLNGNVITLWSPNHKYTTVRVTDLVASATDSCDSSINLSSVRIASVTSDEASNGSGDGNTLGDILIAPGCNSVMLLAERAGNGNGRVYTIRFEVADASGNVGTATAKVTVPNSQNGSAAVDDGPQYIVLGACP